jgi:chromosome segregation ATPase
LFNQQTEVTQTIGNLLDIIRRQSTNSQQAQADINTFGGLLNASVTNQQQIALSISQAEAKVNNIQNAINGANGQLDSLNAQQNKINGQISSVKNNGLNLTQQLSAALNNQDGLKNQINIVNSSVTTIK